jgi:tetratricopeptide (TPR) repeat protein
MRICALVGGITVAGIAIEPIPTRAQDVCVAPTITESITSCEGFGGPMDPSISRRGGPAALGSAGPSTSNARPSEPPTPGLTGEPLRTPTVPRQEVRRRELIERERQVLERLARNTPESDARHGDVLYRLAQTLGELVSQHETAARMLDERIFEARQRHDARATRRLVERQRGEERAARDDRTAAIQALAQLVAAHPTRPNLDEVLYSLAYQLERIDRAAQARQVYHRILRAFPESRYVPHAYLAFAEHAFGEGELDAARQFYERVLTIPPERNALYGYARYKLAWVRYNQEDFRGALDEFVAVIEHVSQHPDEPESASLARQARREIVLPYSRVGSPARALAFFRRVAPTGEDAFAMLEALAQLYHDTGHWAESVAVHHQLMAERSDDASLCAWQARVLDATIASQPKPRQVLEATRAVELRAVYAQGSHDEEHVRACDEEVATATVLLATAWHREAVGTDDQPGTRDATTMRAASDLYALLEDAFPTLESMRLPRIDRRDRPSAAQIAFFHGDLLYELQRWRECASAFERALERAPPPQLAADAAYGAVLCYDRHLGARQPPPTPDDRQLSRRELTDEEQRMARTFHRFSCVAPRHEELPVVLYRWARLHYEANQFEEASVLFTRVAMDHPSSEVAEYAGNLSLDSLGVLAERRGHAMCFAMLRTTLHDFSARFCGDAAGREAHGGLCAPMHSLQCDVDERAADELGRAGRHREAADALLALVRREPICPASPRLLYDAAIHFEAARLLGRAIRVRTVLIDTYPDHPLSHRAIAQVGANYHALAIYDRAAEHYERYATHDGRCADAETAEACPDPADGLRSAVLFRLGLGQTDQAVDDAERFERLYRRTQPRMVAEVVFAIGAVHERDERWPRLVDHYRSFVRRYARDATPTQLARAHVLAARGFLRQGDRGRAEPHLRAAIEIQARGGEAAIDALGLEGDARERERLLLRDAVAEARYELAEAARLRFEALRFPVFRRSATLSEVTRWSEGELAPWLVQKQALLREAEAAYGEVAPLAIPRWQIAAASRVGDMFMSVVAQVLESPVPDEIARDPDLLDLYDDTLVRVVEPLEQVATQRYEFCLTTATRARWFDDRSHRCEEALNRLDAVRFPVASELRGRSGHTPDTGAPPGAVELPHGA